MYRIPEMPRPGSAFAQSFIQGLQLGGLFRQAQEQKEEREEERKARFEQNAWKLATTMAKTDPKLANTFLEKQLGITGAFEIPTIEVGAKPERRERETIPAEMPGVPEIDQETIIPRVPGKKFPVSRSFQQKWQQMKAIREQYGPEAAQRYMIGELEGETALEVKERYALLGNLLPEDHPQKQMYQKLAGTYVAPEKGKKPTPSMYEWKSVGKGLKQKMVYNPKSKKHDIPFGEPQLIFKPGKEKTEEEFTFDEALKLMRKSQFTGMIPSEEEALVIYKRTPDPKDPRLRNLYFLQYGRMPEQAEIELPLETPPPFSAEDYDIGYRARNPQTGVIWVIEKDATSGTKRWRRIK